jgi:hypothetical protein
MARVVQSEARALPTRRGICEDRNSSTIHKGNRHFFRVFELVVVDGLRQSLESTTLTRPPLDVVPIPAIPNGPVVSPRKDPTPKPNAKPVIKPIDAQSERPVGRPVAADVPHNPTHEIAATPKPTQSLDVVENKTPSVVANPPPIVVAHPLPSIPAPSKLDRGDGVQLEGLDNIFAEPPTLDRGHGIQLEGMGNIVGDFGVGKAGGSSSSKETPPKSGQGFGHWLPTLRGIKLRIEQSTSGTIERLSHLDQVRVPSRSSEKEPYPSLPYIT